MRALVSFVAAVGLFAGCASSSPPPPPPAAVAPPPPPPARPKRRRRTRVSEIAARAPDEQACDAAARKLYQEHAGAGFSLLIACINQDKYRDLDGLFEGPWSARVQGLPAESRMRLAAQVVSIRGADLPSDLPRLASRGIRLLGLSDALVDRAKPGTHLLFRGVVAKRELQTNGAMRLTIAEIGRATLDRRARRTSVVTRQLSDGRTQQFVTSGVEKVGSVDRRFLTGVFVESDVYDLPLLVREGAEFVFLARLGKVDEDGIATVQTLDVFKHGVILPDF